MSKVVQDIGVLRLKSEDVTTVEEAQDLIHKLEAALGKMDNGVGLAAIQLGYPKRVGVIKHPKDGLFLHLINPKIVEGLDEFVYMREGCLSFPKVFRDTKRYRQITVEHKVIRDGKFEDETFVSYYSPDTTEPGNDGLVTIAIQHELDHFDGKLILDYDIKAIPVKRDRKKVGRNDPCPCGSGKKYKKCCGK